MGRNPELFTLSALKTILLSLLLRGFKEHWVRN